MDQKDLIKQIEAQQETIKALQEQLNTYPKPSPITSDTPHIPTQPVENIDHILGSINGHLDKLKHYQNYYGNVPRVYYRGEEQLEGLVARLRGELAKIEDLLGDLIKILIDIINAINNFIDNFSKWLHDIFPKLEVIYGNGDYEPGSHLMDQNHYRQLGRRNEPVALGAYGDWYAKYTNSFFNVEHVEDDANKRLFYFKQANNAADVFAKQKEQVTEYAVTAYKNGGGNWFFNDTNRYNKHGHLLFRDDLGNVERIGAEVQRVYVDTRGFRVFYQKADGIHVYNFNSQASTGVQTPHTSNFLVGTVDAPDGFHLFYISSNADGSYKLYDYNTSGTDRLVWEIDKDTDLARALDPASDVFLNGANEISVKLGSQIKSFIGFFHTFEHHKSYYSENTSKLRFSGVLTGVTNLDLSTTDGRMVNNSIMSDLNADDYASGSYGVNNEAGNPPAGNGYMYAGLNIYANYVYSMFSTEDNMGQDTYGFHVYKVKPSHAPHYENHEAHFTQVARLTDALGRSIPLSEVNLGQIGGDIVNFLQTGYYYIEPKQARSMLSFTHGTEELPSLSHLWRSDLQGVLLENKPDSVTGTTMQIATLMFADGDFAEYVRSINGNITDRTSGMWGYNATSIAEAKGNITNLAHFATVDGFMTYGKDLAKASDYPYNDSTFTFNGQPLDKNNPMAKSERIHLEVQNINSSEARQLLYVVSDHAEIRFSRTLTFTDTEAFVYGYEWPTSVSPWILEQFEYDQNAGNDDKHVVDGGDDKQPGNQNVTNNITNIYNTIGDINNKDDQLQNEIDDIKKSLLDEWGPAVHFNTWNGLTFYSNWAPRDKENDTGSYQLRNAFGSIYVRINLNGITGPIYNELLQNVRFNHYSSTMEAMSRIIGYHNNLVAGYDLSRAVQDPAYSLESGSSTLKTNDTTTQSTWNYIGGIDRAGFLNNEIGYYLQELLDGYAGTNNYSRWPLATEGHTNFSIQLRIPNASYDPTSYYDQFEPITDPITGLPAYFDKLER